MRPSGPFSQSGYSCVAETKKVHTARMANTGAATEAMSVAVVSESEVVISRGQWIYNKPSYEVCSGSLAQTSMATVTLETIAKMQ